MVERRYSEGVIGVNLLRLPSWAGLRRSQMEGIAERLALLTASQPEPEPPKKNPGSP